MTFKVVTNSMVGPP